MKNTLLRYGLLSISYIIITEITNEIINLKDLLRNFLIDFLSKDQINSYFEFQDKWHWLNHLYIPLIILVKTLIIATTLYIGLFLFTKETKFKNSWNVVIKAEFIFILVPIIKIIWFYFFQTSYTLDDIQNFYPLSALNIIGYKDLEAWFIYPFQVLNLFELSYVIYLGFQIGELTNTNTDYGLKIVGLSYVPCLLLWVATVMFFTLNYS
ncbi:hypothetical protein B0A79_17730 [Flavobacterium piscis]|uniref:Yip1 domain-containing protein n=1 Tax=Flavobacterium piscis TaxID=1114874 RepID=A0ABX2XL98_9FLAO|nr:hypothetical protein [Flavobacterium piscis]OCB76216.1 hypothetical protein FLP_05850 [Flavobacterium piscis]OXG00735.1 hypothetical protein B0A79_17730 [Flavobacterium piscis]